MYYLGMKGTANNDARSRGAPTEIGAKRKALAALDRA